MIKLGCKLATGAIGEAGKLPSFTSLGGYPVFYLVRIFRDEQAWCPACCNTEDEDDAKIFAADINWEDPQLYCECCCERIESAYAEDEVTHGSR